MASIVNRKATKKFIKQMAEVHRPGWEFTRVSEKAIIAAELKMKEWIIKQVKILPSMGKTIIFDGGEYIE